MKIGEEVIEEIRRMYYGQEDRRMICYNFCRALFWNVKEVEDALRAKADQDKQELVAKLDDIRDVIKKERAAEERRTERIVMAIKDSAREKRYSRRVLKSVEEMDGDLEKSKKSGAAKFAGGLSEEDFKAEEARILGNLRQDDANLQAIRGMSHRLRSRRKTRSEAPRSLKMPIQVVNLEEEDDGEENLVEMK